MTNMDLATVDKLLTPTRSVRRRLDLTRAVEPALIEQCLEIAVEEPTGSNLCRYHVIVVTDAGKRRNAWPRAGRSNPATFHRGRLAQSIFRMSRR
jgi:nitroreductase